MRRSNMFKPYCTTSTRRVFMHAAISSRVKFETPTNRDLALADDVVERAHRLLERRRAVGPVHEVHVDVVGAEVLQALVDRRADALRALLSRKFGLSG